METKVIVYLSHAGVSCRPTKANYKKLTDEFKRLNGKVDWVGDKAVCLIFPDSIAADAYLAKSKSLGEDSELENGQFGD